MTVKLVALPYKVLPPDSETVKEQGLSIWLPELSFSVTVTEKVEYWATVEGFIAITVLLNAVFPVEIVNQLV